MQIWHYHPITRELLGAGFADPCQVEEGAWLVPAFATPTAPPEKPPGQALVFGADGWTGVPDHRGETWWKADAEFNNAPQTITSLGDPTAFEPPLTSVEPPAMPVPPIVVSAMQIRLALNQLGLRAAVEGWVQAADQDTIDTWQFGSAFSRAGSPPADAAEAYGKTPEEVDGLFELAKTL